MWVQLIIHLLQLRGKVLQYKPNLPLTWAARRKALFAFLDSQFGGDTECWVIPWVWAPHRKGLVAFLGGLRLEKAICIVGLKYQWQLCIRLGLPTGREEPA